MSFAGKNLKYLRHLKGWTQEAFAKKIKNKRASIGAYEEGRAEPNLETLRHASRLFKVSLDALLLQDLENIKSKTYLEKRRRQKLTSEVVTITFIPVKAAAGYIAGYSDPDFIDELNTFTLPMLSAGSYRAFEIVGDSMLPTPSGAVIVGEKVEKMEDTKNNQTYIIVSKREGIVYKRILKSNRSKQKITLVSDNPSYQPYQINTEDVLEIWQASMVINRANEQQRWDVNQLASLVNNLQNQVSSLKKKIN